MKTSVTLVLLVLMFALLSCASPFFGNSAQPLPQSQPSATPYIAESYPTTAADLISPNQIVSGFDVRVERAWQDGKQVYTDVCFTIPDASDWTIWSASLKYGEVIIQEYGATQLSLQAPTGDGQPGLRCDMLEFYVPPDANLATVTISIEKIGVFPRQEDYCAIYMPKIQQSFNERGIAITLACIDVNGMQNMQIASKPDIMSQEEAEQLIYSDEFFTITGPWEFTFNITQ